MLIIGVLTLNLLKVVVVVVVCCCLFCRSLRKKDRMA